MSSILKADGIIICRKNECFSTIFWWLLCEYIVLCFDWMVFQWKPLYDSSERIWNSCVAVMTLMLCFIKLMKTALKCIELRITSLIVVSSGFCPTTGGICIDQIEKGNELEAMHWNLRVWALNELSVSYVQMELNFYLYTSL